MDGLRQQSKPNVMAGILAGGLVAGALDLLYAFVLVALEGTGPRQVLHAIASGLLGRAAYEGGDATAALGFALHFLITVVAASVYYGIARNGAYVRERYWLSGAIFGALVYLFMNFGVVALSRVPFQLTYTPSIILQGLVSHAVLVGLPIAYAMERLCFRRTRRLER
jgi:hypothetical protein